LKLICGQVGIPATLALSKPLDPGVQVRKLLGPVFRAAELPASITEPVGYLPERRKMMQAWSDCLDGLRHARRLRRSEAFPRNAHGDPPCALARAPM